MFKSLSYPFKMANIGAPSLLIPFLQVGELKECIELAHKEAFEAYQGPKDGGTRIAYVVKAREYFLAKYPVTTHPQQNERLQRLLPDSQAVTNRMKSLFQDVRPFASEFLLVLPIISVLWPFLFIPQ